MTIRNTLALLAVLASTMFTPNNAEAGVTTCYEPAEAGHAATHYLSPNVEYVAVKVDSGIVVNTDQRGNTTLKTMPGLCRDQLAWFRASDVVDGFIPAGVEGILDRCNNRFTTGVRLQVLAYNQLPTDVRDEISEFDLQVMYLEDLYSAVRARDLRVSYLYAIWGAIDWQGGGDLIVRADGTTQWNAGDLLSCHVQPEVSSSDLSAYVQDVGNDVPFDMVDSRWAALTECAGDMDTCPSDLSPADAAILPHLIRLEKGVDYSFEVLLDRMDRYFMANGVTIRTGRNNTTIYSFPADECPTVAEITAERQAESLDTYLAGTRGFRGYAGFGGGAVWNTFPCSFCNRPEVISSLVLRGGIGYGNEWARVSVGPRFGTALPTADGEFSGYSVLGGDVEGRFFDVSPVGMVLRYHVAWNLAPQVNEGGNLSTVAMMAQHGPEVGASLNVGQWAKSPVPVAIDFMFTMPVSRYQTDVDSDGILEMQQHGMPGFNIGVTGFFGKRSK